MNRVRPARTAENRMIQIGWQLSAANHAVITLIEERGTNPGTLNEAVDTLRKDNVNDVGVLTDQRISEASRNRAYFVVTSVTENIGNAVVGMINRICTDFFGVYNC